MCLQIKVVLGISAVNKVASHANIQRSLKKYRYLYYMVACYLSKAQLEVFIIPLVYWGRPCCVPTYLCHHNVNVLVNYDVINNTKCVTLTELF